MLFCSAEEGNEDSDEKFLKDAGLSRQHTYAIRRRMTALRTTMKVRRGKWSREARITRGETSDGSSNIEAKVCKRKEQERVELVGSGKTAYQR